MNHLGKIGTVLGIIAGVLPQIPGVPPYVPYVVGALSGIALFLAKSPMVGGLTPSVGEPGETGPALGKASGEAGQAAGKGPFTRG